ncbi:tripartite tricarboxylate transporter substrate binding protein [Cupriavidus cauae]|uniref:tripartite tricarboxylate transporter substrate binding protein n=1 Tax=Cupriavidus TaxID=106589 RepID=UPI001CF20B55|nr:MULTISPECIES: tripartite tricarboxylate transporter substrate binding protein [Cupriavidus]MCA7082933.1 tripartite tricarboxylate transporter substrate binding protein [Cupriavidus sp. DB3]UZN51091.1 tripartite tricarboxylate transporter substrate binding protein [Cupriavidus cauae]
MNQHALRAGVAALALAATLLPGVCTAAPAAASTTQADGYPNRPIRMIIGFPPGGPTDIVARVIGQALGDRLGQPIVVENRPGAGGNIAAEAVAKAQPDGYTLLYNTSSIAIAPWVYAHVNYDPVKDFAPVALTAEMPLVLMVNPSVPARTPKDLVQLIRSRPGQLNYGSSGTGAIEHLSSAQFNTMFHLKATHVPYKGTAPALVDFLAGETQFMMTTLNTALPYIRDGRLKALAVTSRQRTATLPDVPTVAEAMSADYASTAWQGLVAPARTPAAVIGKLNQAVNAVLANPAVRKVLAEQGVDALGGSPERYGAFIQSEYARWQSVVKASGAKIE